MRKTLTIWLCVMILGAAAAASHQAAADDVRVGTWTGTWEGEGSTGGFELTIEKNKEGVLAGRVSVTGEPTYKATLKVLAEMSPFISMPVSMPTHRTNTTPADGGSDSHDLNFCSKHSTTGARGSRADGVLELSAA